MYYPSSETKVNAKLICVFVFAYANCLFSHEAAHFFNISIYYFKFGNFGVTFISRFFCFRIISEIFNSRVRDHVFYEVFIDSLLARTWIIREATNSRILAKNELSRIYFTVYFLLPHFSFVKVTSWFMALNRTLIFSRMIDIKNNTFQSK